MEKGSEVLTIKVFAVDEEKGEYLTEIMIGCKALTLIGGLSEAIYKINEAANRTGKFPKNGLWTLICEMVGDRLLEESKKM